MCRFTPVTVHFYKSAGRLHVSNISEEVTSFQAFSKLLFKIWFGLRIPSFPPFNLSQAAFPFTFYVWTQHILLQCKFSPLVFILPCFFTIFGFTLTEKGENTLTENLV